jgi:hypothetical protein
VGINFFGNICWYDICLLLTYVSYFVPIHIIHSNKNNYLYKKPFIKITLYKKNLTFDAVVCLIFCAIVFIYRENIFVKCRNPWLLIAQNLGGLCCVVFLGLCIRSLSLFLNFLYIKFI